MDFATVNQCLLEQNNGLASIAFIDHGFSSPSSENHRHGGRLISQPLYSSRATSFKNLYSFSSPRSGTLLNGRYQEQQPHFLYSCLLCKKPLGCNRDIFMYRGNEPFCSEECRAEQIEIDEAKEKERNLSASIKALRKKEGREKSSPNYPFHSRTVAAA